MERITTDECVGCETEMEDGPWNYDGTGSYCKECWEKKYPPGKDLLIILGPDSWMGFIDGHPLPVAPGTYEIKEDDGHDLHLIGVSTKLGIPGPANVLIEFTTDSTDASVYGTMIKGKICGKCHANCSVEGTDLCDKCK